MSGAAARAPGMFAALVVTTGKDEPMHTRASLTRWKRILQQDLLDLQHLRQQRPFSHVRYTLKEQELGQHCCQAGEVLIDPHLAMLKQTLDIDEDQWRSYRRKVRPGPEEPDETKG